MTKATFVDLIHGILIALWVMCMPFLFWHGHPELSTFCAVYSLVFVTINRVSHWTLDECILTRMARWVGGFWDGEWYTVKVARKVCGINMTKRQAAGIEWVFVIAATSGAILTLLHR